MLVVQLVVAASVIGVLHGDPHQDGGGRDRIELLSTASAACAAIGARDARYVYREKVVGAPVLSGSAIAGCWAVRGQHVVAVFEDGDSYRIPKHAIDWSSGPGGPDI